MNTKILSKNRVHRTGSEKAVQYTLAVVFALYSLTLLFPLFWAFSQSLKTQQEFTLNPPYALPEEWVFGNYVEAFSVLQVNGTGFFGMIVNSLWYAFGMCIGNVFVCSMGGYIIARYPFKGSNTIYSAILIMMLMPIIGSGPAAFKMYNALGLLNNPLFIISNAGIMGINFLFLEGFYRNVSWSYAEAAFIDGASHYRVYFEIMFPQALSMVSTLVIMQFVQYWNDYATPLLYLSQMPTLATGLYQYEKSMIRGANMPVYYAGLLISVLPVLVIFCAFQNSIMEKVSLGGLKG